LRTKTLLINRPTIRYKKRYNSVRHSCSYNKNNNWVFLYNNWVFLYNPKLYPNPLVLWHAVISNIIIFVYHTCHCCHIRLCVTPSHSPVCVTPLPYNQIRINIFHFLHLIRSTDRRCVSSAMVDRAKVRGGNF